MKQKHYDVESMAKLINFSDNRAELYIVLILFRSLNRQFRRSLPVVKLSIYGAFGSFSSLGILREAARMLR